MPKRKKTTGLPIDDLDEGRDEEPAQFHFDNNVYASWSYEDLLKHKARLQDQRHQIAIEEMMVWEVLAEKMPPPPPEGGTQ